MLRCYQCGRPIEEGTQQKRVVQVGHSYGSGTAWGPGSGWMWGGGRTDEFAEVWVCPACAADQDRCSCLIAWIVGVVLLGAVAMMVILCAGVK